MTATVIDFRAAVERRYARTLAHRAIAASAPVNLTAGESVMILGTGQHGVVMGVYSDGRALVKIVGSIASTLAPLSQLVRLDGPGGAA